MSWLCATALVMQLGETWETTRTLNLRMLQMVHLYMLVLVLVLWFCSVDMP